MCTSLHAHHVCVVSVKTYFFMHSHVLHCVCVCVCLMPIFLCEMTDIVKDGWLGRLNTWMCMCLCDPGEPCSVVVLTGWGVSEHLSQGHLQHSIRSSDPSVWPLPGPPLGPTSPVCASPLGMILSGLVYKKAAGDDTVTRTPTSERVQYQLSITVKPPG